MRIPKVIPAVCLSVLLLTLWGCDEDKPTQPTPASHYPVYFAMAGINDDDLMYFKYHPSNGEFDSFYLPLNPDEMTVTANNTELWICRSDSLYIVDLKSKSIVDQMISPFGCNEFVFSPDNRLAASGGGQVRIVKTTDYSLVFSDSSIGSQGRFSIGDFSADGGRYYCADCYNYLYRVDLANNNEVTRWNLETHGGIYCARPSPDETKIFFVSQIGYDYCLFSAFDIARDSVISSIVLGPYPVRFRLSGDGRMIYLTAGGNMFSILQPSFSFAVYDVCNLIISQIVEIPSYLGPEGFFYLGRFIVTADDHWLIGKWWGDPMTMVTYDLHTMDTTRFHRFVNREPTNFTIPYKP